MACGNLMQKLDRLAGRRERKAHTRSGKFIWFQPRLGRISVVPRRAEDGNRLPLIPPINSEIALVDGDNRVARIEFAHADETKVGQIRLAIHVTPRQLSQLWKVF